MVVVADQSPKSRVHLLAIPKVHYGEQSESSPLSILKCAADSCKLARKYQDLGQGAYIAK